MRLKYKVSSALSICAAAALVLTFTTISKTAPTTENLPVGRVPLTSAGPMAFGPNGVLFSW